MDNESNDFGHVFVYTDYNNMKVVSLDEYVKLHQSYIKLQKRFEEAVEAIKIIDINFSKITKCPDNTCDGCHEDAKIAAEYSRKFLSSLDKENK